jgi:hypothetical protein
VNPEAKIVIEIFGEGKTDVGHDPMPKPPSEGVVPILLNLLCGKPRTMTVKRLGKPFLQQKGTGKGLWQKVRFAKRQASYNGSAAAVFVMDSEGKLSEKSRELQKGRDSELPHFPMAIGVAHPCIEVWLLADPSAIRRGLGLERTPEVSEKPEELPAPCIDGKNNPKTVLAQAAGSNKQELSAAEKDLIAQAMNDMNLVCKRCPTGFAPFEKEVTQHIRPLFQGPS